MIRNNIVKTLNQLRRTLTSSLVVLIGVGTVEGLRAQERTVSGDAAADLSAKCILQRVRLAYACLSTYRDTGWTMHQYRGDAWTNTFSELLGTRTCYRVEIITAAHPYSQTNRCWCDGLEHYYQMGGQALIGSSELPGNLNRVYDDTSLPAVYFLLSWGNVFTPFKLGPDAELVRRPDETVGGESCYVLARTTPANPATLWVAKRDFLIRRCQMHGRIETHENISTNELFHAEDYVPVDIRGDQILKPKFQPSSKRHPLEEHAP